MAVPQSFPAKIYQILENESPEIIQWNENGQSFRIMDHGRFEREIVPKYFRHNQISSVQRQLNLYGFKCISRGEFKRSFFHPKFRRGEWETVKKLTRFVPTKKGSPSSENLSEQAAPEPPSKEEAPPSTSAPATSEVKAAVPAPSGFMPFVYSYPTLQPVGQSGQPQTHSLRGYTAWNENWDNQATGPQLMAVPLMTPAESTASFLNNTRMTFQNWVPRVTIPTGANAAQVRGATAGAPARLLSSSALTSSGMHVDASAAQGSNMHVMVNPDYDLMVEFGMFDGLPLTDLVAHSPRLAQQQGFPHDHDHAHAQGSLQLAPLHQPSARAQLSGNALAAHPAQASTPAGSAAAVHCPADAESVSSAFSSVKSDDQQHRQEQTQPAKSSGVDACCMTDITFSEELQAFIRRENIA